MFTKGSGRELKVQVPIQNDLAILCVCNGLAVSHRH